MSLELPPGVCDVVTLHDTVAWTEDDEAPPVRSAVEELQRAAAVIAVSQFTADDAAHRLGVEPTHIIPNGVSPPFFDAVPMADEELSQWGIHQPFVLHSGGASRRKNLGALAAAWPVVADRFPEAQLVLIGPHHPRRTELFRDLPGTTHLGMVPDSSVPGLVAAASAVVVPSLIEGFGLPALEAMAAGTPVVAADTSALPEVVGDAGILVSPDSAGLVQGLSSALAEGQFDPALKERGRARASQFTWDRSARAHAAVWSAVA